MKVQITHSCSHTREIEVKGVREGRQYAKWLGSHQCPACAEKAEEDQAKVSLVQMGVKPLNDMVFSAPSETEEQDHIVTVVNDLAQSCTCKWFKHGGWKQHKCKHGLAVEAYIREEEAVHQAVA